MCVKRAQGCCFWDIKLFEVNSSNPASFSPLLKKLAEFRMKSEQLWRTSSCSTMFSDVLIPDVPLRQLGQHGPLACTLCTLETATAWHPWHLARFRSKASPNPQFSPPQLCKCAQSKTLVYRNVYPVTLSWRDTVASPGCIECHATQQKFQCAMK
jgi:hypothetical protein